MNSLPSLATGQAVAASIEHGQQHGEHRRPQHETDHRPVEPDEHAVDRVAVLGDDAAAHEEQHQHRHQRDRQQGAARHGEGLGVGERLEEPPFLILEREDRQERDHDHEQAEEQRRPHFLGRRDERRPARLRRGGSRSTCLCAFSIMTIAASTMAPSAIAMPPRLMMLEPMPSACMPANAISTPIGSVRMATSALRACRRNSTHTAATMRLSSMSVRVSVWMARPMSSERS